MSHLKYYIELYIAYFKVNMKSVMIYDIDYLIGIVAMIIKNIVNFGLILLLFHLIENIEGWTFNEMLFLYGYSTTAFAIWHCFFINVITIPYYIQIGTFDRFLLKPVNPIFQIMMDGFDEDGWGELIFGIIVLMIAIIRLDIWSYKLMFLPILLFSSCFIYAGLSLIASTVSFFTIGSVDLTNLAMECQEFTKYPISIYNFSFRILFTCIIPVGFAAFYPSLYYMSKYMQGAKWLIITPLVTFGFFVLSCKLWNKALQKYSSSGS